MECPIEDPDKPFPPPNMPWTVESLGENLEEGPSHSPYLCPWKDQGVDLGGEG